MEGAETTNEWEVVPERSNVDSDDISRFLVGKSQDLWLPRGLRSPEERVEA